MFLLKMSVRRRYTRTMKGQFSVSNKKVKELTSFRDTELTVYVIPYEKVELDDILNGNSMNENLTWTTQHSVNAVNFFDVYLRYRPSMVDFKVDRRLQLTVNILTWWNLSIGPLRSLRTLWSVVRLVCFLVLILVCFWFLF